MCYELFHFTYCIKPYSSNSVNVYALSTAVSLTLKTLLTSVTKWSAHYPFWSPDPETLLLAFPIQGFWYPAPLFKGFDSPIKSYLFHILYASLCIGNSVTSWRLGVNNTIKAYAPSCECYLKGKCCIRNLGHNARLAAPQQACEAAYRSPQMCSILHDAFH